MTYYIGSARHDENGGYAGGKPGDQTGQEVTTQKMYDYPSKGGWICFRAKDGYVADSLKKAMLIACGNDNIGYSQSDRYGVVKNGINSRLRTNADCSSLVRACIKYAAGYDTGDFNTGNEAAVLSASGLFAKVGKVTKSSKLYDGDILVTAKKGHTAIVTSGKANIDASIYSSSSNVLKGISYGNAFTGNSFSESINASKASVAERKLLRTMVLQHALNLDYKAGLAEDGIFGEKTKEALGKHYVKYGETQYMVTAAEILYYLLGENPGGVEMPGVFGKGLKTAADKSKITAEDFISLL